MAVCWSRASGTGFVPLLGVRCSRSAESNRMWLGRRPSPARPDLDDRWCWMHEAGEVPALGAGQGDVRSGWHRPGSSGVRGTASGVCRNGQVGSGSGAGPW